MAAQPAGRTRDELDETFEILDRDGAVVVFGGDLMERGFGIVSAKATEDTRLSSSAKGVYAYFCAHAGAGTHSLFPSVDTICTHLAMSRNTYYRHRRTLVECGYISVHQGRAQGQGRYLSNRYVVNAEIPEERAAAFRRDHLGFVFQDFSLLDTFSLEDNILLPLVLQGKSRGEMKSRLVPLADRLGIDCDTEADKFRDRALDSGARSADWNAKYRNWLVKGKERGFATPKDSGARRRFTWGSEEVKRVLGPIACEGTDTYMALACKVADLLNQGLDPDMLRRQLANVPDDAWVEQLFEQEAAA